MIFRCGEGCNIIFDEQGGLPNQCQRFGRISVSKYVIRATIADDKMQVNMGPSWFLPLLLLTLHPQVDCSAVRERPLNTNRNGSQHIYNYPPEEEFHDEHDMTLTQTQAAALHLRKANSDLTTYWDDDNGFPLIPFTFIDHSINRVTVWKAILKWEQSTCINFTEVDPSYSGAHLKFVRHADTCSSSVGKVSAAGQEVYLTTQCENEEGTLLHLIGYAIGFWPEETRSDRNSYIRINTDNVLPVVSDNFPLNNDNSYSVPYDYCSIMHSYERRFTSNGKITVTTLNPLYQGAIGQRLYISHMDKLLANTMYQCSDKLLSQCSLASDPCQNYGYLDTSCACVCPDGTEGTNCETVTSAYQEHCLSPYSETLTTENVISSPSDSTNPVEVKFTKVIEAPYCNMVVAYFTNFNLYQRTDHYINESTTANICWYDGLEVRTHDMYDGTWYCGTELHEQTIMSKNNMMILYFTSKMNFMPGWTVSITFEEIVGCSRLVLSQYTPL
ncbi:protein SpAN-like [Penaeus chinensis]|uniref:protein SpAN-like n=1 Tax=Penaeus chinensis TaxID=139456 RepID=UPI001FB78E01|nr:protein SpAN-like [Penaeus chinensis]